MKHVSSVHEKSEYGTTLHGNKALLNRSMRMKSIVLGGGCFWCLEAAYTKLRGVSAVVSGYAGGTVPSPTYEAVSSGTTGHAEVVRIEYDPDNISLEDILHVFFTIHDPTTLNRQGNDTGTQYRSAIFYANQEECRLAELVRDEVIREAWYPGTLVTQIVLSCRGVPSEVLRPPSRRGLLPDRHRAETRETAG